MKKLRLLAALIAMPLWVCAQDIAVYFEIIPEEQLMQIDANRRKDMIDLKKAGQPASFPNRLGGVSEMTELTNDYLRIRVSDNSTFEMKLLPVNGQDNILAVVRTTCAPACDSEILFYTPTWQRLPQSDFIDLPSRMDFLLADTDTSDAGFQEKLGLIDMDLISLNLSADTNDLTATYSLESYLPEDLYKELKRYIKPEALIYRWENGRFVLK